MARWHTQEPARFEGQELEPEKWLLQAYYSRSRIDSPLAGPLNPLLVRYEGDGTGIVLFECLVSSLRYWLRIPKATRSERARVREQQAEAFDPTCPRCDPADRLVRSGPYLVCPHCGVRYGRP
ncbi:MAG: hypothetical protein RQ745_11805 [Longimicrobiales bacterium]|nr:hypothetical protein [Longimicrobiales bacterium]